MKTSKQIRQEFLDFFNKKNHKIIKSAPSIPQNDPTLLFTNAGMNQFKGIFLNTEEITNPRVADTQKCIRVSGKHNDLEEVGHDTYHHTYFEMLGNWSFGDYYKKEAIQFAWELLTKVWEMDKERLWVTVYKDDKEAEDYWKQFTDIAPDRILKFGDKDNFWEMGETGPCGPCSEIHYYSGDTPKNQEAKKINADDPEYIEIWNLVFIQYNRNSKGLSPLPKKHVDTGMGFERVVAVLQNKKSNYDTDLFQPIIQKVAQISKIPYSQEKGIPHRVIADHIRMLTISLSDGGLPSNEGRGYVMRRILRRAVRYGKMLNLHEPFLFQLVDNVVNILGDIFPEIVDKKEHIQKVIKAEEVSFSETLDRGLEVFEKLYKSTIDNNSKILSGKDAFKLYDTFGFPLDLTCLIAREKNLDVDQDGFNKEMEKQKQRARESAGFKIAKNDQTEWITLSQGEDSEFIGYNKLSCSSKIRKYGFEKNHIKLILSKTVFYAESGGEIGDVGEISGKDFTIKIENTVKSNNMFIHIGQIQQGQIGKNPDVVLKVDSKSDSAIRSNHSATHLLHSALKSVLGDHIQQAGSLVTDERLRFDLTHYEKISVDEIFKIENIINNKIRENLLISKTVKSYDEAKKEGATALFGEKYGNEVRVVTIPNFSKELCGGKHAKRTGDIGIFKIIAESSVAAGVRRIEAITGSMAWNYLQADEKLIISLENLLETDRQKLFPKIEKLIESNKNFQNQISKQESLKLKDVVEKLIANSDKNGKIQVIKHNFDNKSVNDLKQAGDIIREKLYKGIGIFTSVFNDKPVIVVAVSDSLIKEEGIKAGDIIKKLAKIIGGGGGGRPHMATAGGKNSQKIPEMFEESDKIIEEYFK